jgi:SET domain-containing protein
MKGKAYGPTEWINPRVETRPSPIHGKGMFASTPIRQGEVVNIWGGTFLLTEEDMRRGDTKREWRANGYVWSTIGEGLYLGIRLDENNEDLTNFVNHSCEPTVWMQDEVTLVARRDIAVGEELMVDYAMFEGGEEWVGRFEVSLRFRALPRPLYGQGLATPGPPRALRGALLALHQRADSETASF